jgi:ubiquinone/menaquinone biosynthesis C-methylase UbiE
MSESAMPKVAWDYTDLAAHYDKRADYAAGAIADLLALAAPDPERPVADIGAGTGKLTKELLAQGCSVHAVEPNEAMRTFGIANTMGLNVVWSVGTGEATGLAAKSYDLVTFGSSFNVTDRQRTLREVERILRPQGWFACMWNHRDLDDPLQAAVEDTIRSNIPEYSYGSRREDQTQVIRDSGLFDTPVALEGSTINRIPVDDYVDAWRSHATLQRQAKADFHTVIAAIEALFEGSVIIAVPYTTRIWCARLL